MGLPDRRNTGACHARNYECIVLSRLCKSPVGFPTKSDLAIIATKSTMVTAGVKKPGHLQPGKDALADAEENQEGARRACHTHQSIQTNPDE